MPDMESRRERITNLVTVTLVTVLISCLMLAPGVQEWLTKVETIFKLVIVLHQIV